MGINLKSDPLTKLAPLSICSKGSNYILYPKTNPSNGNIIIFPLQILIFVIFINIHENANEMIFI